MNARSLATALFAALVLLFAGGKAAALGETCSIVSPTGIAFGTYTAAADKPSTGTFSVRCRCTGVACTGVSYRVRIDAGTSGSFAVRQMDRPGSRLNYSLSTHSGMLPIWGDGSNGTAAPTACYILLVGGEVTINYTVYGLVPSSQFAQPGLHSDPLTITVEYFTAVPPLVCPFPP